MSLPGLSDETKELFERFWELKTGPLSFIFQRAEILEKQRILAAIAAKGELRSVPYLSVLLGPGNQFSQVAAQAIDSVLVDQQPEILMALFESFRQQMESWWDFTGSWFHQLRVTDLQRMGFEPTEYPNAWGILTFHANGYVREDAMRRLAEHKSGAEIPYLIMRLSDWVPEIRLLASELLRSRLQPRFVTVWGRCLLLFFRVSRSARFQDFELLEQSVGLLRRWDNFLSQLVEGDHLHLARLAMDVALLENDALGQAAIEIGRNHPDGNMRLKALEKASGFWGDETVKLLLEQACRDPSARIRKTALEITVQRFPEESRAHLTEALFDSGGMNRYLARYLLADKTNDDFRAMYREALSSGISSRVCGALRGLADIGRPEDATWVLPFVTDPNPKIRRIALKTLSAMARPEHHEVFFAALSDEVVGVSRTAVHALIRLDATLLADEFYELARSTTHYHVRNHALMLLEGLSMRLWDRLLYFMRLVLREKIECDDVTLARFHRVVQQTRRSNIYALPTNAEREELRELIAADEMAVLSLVDLAGLQRFLG